MSRPPHAATAGSWRRLRCCFGPEVLRLHRLIDRGALGEIFYVHARRFALRPELELDLLRDLGLELVALTLDLLGDEPVEAEAYGESYLGRQRPDVIFSKLRFATGIGVHLHLSCLEGESAERISVVGSKATAVLDAADPERALSVYVNGSTPSMFDELPVEPGDKVAFRQVPDDGLRLGCSRFLTAVRSNGDTSFGREASAAARRGRGTRALMQEPRRWRSRSHPRASAGEQNVIEFRARELGSPL